MRVEGQRNQRVDVFRSRTHAAPIRATLPALTPASPPEPPFPAALPCPPAPSSSCHARLSSRCVLLSQRLRVGEGFAVRFRVRALANAAAAELKNAGLDPVARPIPADESGAAGHAPLSRPGRVRAGYSTSDWASYQPVRGDTHMRPSRERGVADLVACLRASDREVEAMGGGWCAACVRARARDSRDGQAQPPREGWGPQKHQHPCAPRHAPDSAHTSPPTHG